MLTGLAVVGVARFLQQRQDFEDATARSYQVEIAARNRLAEGVHRGRGARRRSSPSSTNARPLRDDIDGETRDTALLVGAGLIAGLTGAALLFSGLICLDAPPARGAGRGLRAAGRRRPGRRGSRSADSRRRPTLGAAFNEMAAELQRRAGERDQLETMKDEFVLTASHELRSPLTSVQGFAELLMLERDKLSPKQADTVEIILDNTRHLVRLLNDLLDLARSDAGRLTIKPAPTDVGPLVEDAGADDAQPDRSARARASHLRVDRNLPQISVDRDRIRQVLVNLLTNAHEYCPEGASISVTAERDDAEVDDRRER